MSVDVFSEKLQRFTFGSSDSSADFLVEVKTMVSFIDVLHNGAFVINTSRQTGHLYVEEKRP